MIKKMKKKEKKGMEPAIDSTELIQAMEELEKESGIQKDYLLESIETALVTAYKKNFECEDENVKITMDKETGEIHVYMQKEIVEEVENEKTQMSLEEAKAIDKKYKVGDIYEKELVPKNFGRIAAGTAKQEKLLENFYIMNSMKEKVKLFLV